MKKPTSAKPRKQRKYLAEMPLHRRQKNIASTLSKDLSTQFKRKSIGVRKGDEVIVLRGDHKGAKGEITKVNLKTYKVYVDKIVATKVDGTTVEKPIDPSNLMVLTLNLDDKKRREMLERKEVEVTE